MHIPSKHKCIGPMLGYSRQNQTESGKVQTNRCTLPLLTKPGIVHSEIRKYVRILNPQKKNSWIFLDFSNFFLVYDDFINEKEFKF